MCSAMGDGVPPAALCGKLVRCSRTVLGLAGLKPTTDALKRFIGSVPLGEQPPDRDPDRSSFCVSVLTAAERAPLRAGQFREYRRSANFILDLAEGLSPKQRRRVVDTTLAVLEALA